MILTLTKDVARLGKTGDRVRVSDAYARNVLVPQKMGIVGEQTLFRASEKTKNPVSHDQIKSQVEAPFMFVRKTNEKGGLYEKISHKLIEEEVAKRINISPQQVSCNLEHPAQAVGDFSVECEIDAQKYHINLHIEKA